MEGTNVNDKTLAVLEKYDIEVLRSWKGRSAILCETKTGIKILKEYNGSEKRLSLQKKILEKMEENGFGSHEKILLTKEGELIVKDEEMNSYCLKEYREGKECNLNDYKDSSRAAAYTARLHKSMVLPEVVEEETIQPFSLIDEFEKHNRELRRVKKYLKTKRQKEDFEYFLYLNFDAFLEKAECVVEEMKQIKNVFSSEKLLQEGTLCHGDLQHHNIMMLKEDVYFINFEKFVLDSHMRDLSLFLRKVMEKNLWSKELGQYVLQSYEKEKAITEEEKYQLYYRLKYPEKFWKIVNFYNNSPKAWIPEKNWEKLKNLIAAEEVKNTYLETNFREGVLRK